MQLETSNKSHSVSVRFWCETLGWPMKRFDKVVQKVREKALFYNVRKQLVIGCLKQNSAAFRHFISQIQHTNISAHCTSPLEHNKSALTNYLSWFCYICV